MTTLTVEDLTFTVRRSSRRRSLEIVVDRDGALLVAAPDGCPDETVSDFVMEKRSWIYRRLAEKDALARVRPAKQFVTGEGFSYLGRGYRLLIVDEQPVPLKLEQGRFKLRRDCVPRGREVLVRWYTDHGPSWLYGRVERWRHRVGADVKGLEVRDLGYRWASCGTSGKLYFHWRTILLPPGIVDYLLVHELAHLLEPLHTPAFWQCVARAIGDYDERKAWLASNGVHFVV